MNESIAAETVIFNLLSGSEEITDVVGDRIFTGLGEEGAERPYILISEASANDVTCQSSNILGTRFAYFVECFVDGESFPHATAELIKQALHNTTTDIDVDSSNIRVNINRIRPSKMPDQFQGKEVRRSGGLFETWTRTL